MAMRITKTAVDRLEPDAAKDYFVWDDRLAGFGVKISRGGAKTYVVQYRVKGKTGSIRHSIGRHGAWTADDARAIAETALREADQGRDYRHAAAQQAAAVAAQQAEDEAQRKHTFGWALDLFTERHLKIESPAHWKETRRTLDFDAGRVWGARPLASITRADVEELLTAVLTRPNRRRGADGERLVGSPVQANRLYTALRTMFGFCIRKLDLARNPMEGVDKPAAEASRERVLEDWELRLLWKAAERIGYPFGDITRLLMITLQRRDEVGGMRRSEIVDLGKGTALWTLPPERAKNAKIHDVPLPDAAASIIADLPWQNGLAFTTNGKTPSSGFSRAKEQLDRECFKLRQEEAVAAGRDPADVEPLEHWTFHDLRRTGSTHLAAMGVPQHVTEKLLNHQPAAIRGVAAIYNRYQYLAERRTALDAWASRLGAIVQGTELADNVVVLRRA